MNSYETFWHWFISHEDELLNLEADQEKVFDEVEDALHTVNSHLTFEFGPRDVRRQFVISADGVISAFPDVVELVKAAPKLAKWTIIGFRPRRALPATIEMGGKQVFTESVEFSLLYSRGDKKVGIRLFIPSFDEADVVWKRIGYLLLDESLGEYDVESRVGLIKMYSPNAVTAEERYPLSKLPSAFDRLVSQSDASN